MLLKFPTWAVRLSDFIDTLFPVPCDTEMLNKFRAQQGKIEDAGNYISAQIKSCKSLRQSYSAHKMIANMQRMYGGTTQTQGWVDSLSLELYNKQREILENL